MPCAFSKILSEKEIACFYQNFNLKKYLDCSKDRILERSVQTTNKTSFFSFVAPVDIHENSPIDYFKKYISNLDAVSSIFTLDIPKEYKFLGKFDSYGKKVDTGVSVGNFYLFNLDCKESTIYLLGSYADFPFSFLFNVPTIALSEKDIPLESYLAQMESILGLPQSTVYAIKVPDNAGVSYQILSNFWFNSLWHLEVLCILLRAYVNNNAIKQEKIESFDDWRNKLTKYFKDVYLAHPITFSFIKNIKFFKEMMAGAPNYEVLANPNRLKEEQRLWFGSIGGRINYINGLCSLVYNMPPEFKVLFEKLEKLS